MLVAVNNPVVPDASARPDNHRDMLDLVDAPPESANVLADYYYRRTRMCLCHLSVASGGALPSQYVGCLGCVYQATGPLLGSPDKQLVMLYLLHERTHWYILQPLLY